MNITVINKIKKIIENVAKKTGEYIGYVKVCDTYESKFHDGTKDVTEVDYEFKSGKWGFIELIEDQWDTYVAVNASNEPEGNLEVSDVVELERGWEDEVTNMLVEYHE